MMERMQFTKTNSDGKKVVCEVIATYHHDENNKDYIVYTDKTLDENKQLKIYYALYEQKGNNIKLIETETPEDKRIGLELIKTLIEEIHK